MGSKRIMVSIGEIGEVVGGATPSTKNPQYWDGDIKWISPKDLTNHTCRYIARGEKNITEAGYQACSTKILPAGSVLFSSRAPIGYIAIASNPLCTNQGFKSVVPSSNYDSLFVYYLLKANKEKIANAGSGTTFLEVSGKTMKQIQVEVPESKEEQRIIASVLDSIDSKIELNNRINDYLMELITTHYSSWFVDYSHWGGQVPTGWKLSNLGDYVQVKRGGSPRPIQEFLSDAGFHWLKISDVTSSNEPYVLKIKEHIKENGLNKTIYLQPGNLVLSNSATPGIPKILDIDTCIHDGWLHFPESHFSVEWLYSYFIYTRKNLVRMANGSVFKNLKTDIVKQFKVIVPDDNALSSYQEFIKPIFDNIKINQRENRTLTNLRNTLLPKLMSGEINVSNVRI